MVLTGRFLESRRADVLFLGLPLLWLLVATLPEVMKDRIFPFDSALIAANGALFEAMFSEFARFLDAPVDWLWAYYDQYPALSVRRHPPLFGFVAGIVYSIAGVSTFSAKLTVMLFGLLFACGSYFVARRLFGNRYLAFCVTLLLVATPQIGIHFFSVWLDVPSLAFAIWVFYFYLARLQGDESLKNVLGMVIFAVLTLYTYQPTVVLLAGVFVHLLAREWRTIYRDRAILTGAGLLVLLMLPLAAFTLYFAQDNLQITTGEIPAEWQEFASPTYADWMVRDKLSIGYWTAYARMILAACPLQAAGILLWLLLRPFRKPAAGDVLMFVCLVVTYLVFSWLLVKGHRYTLYMVIPASFLTVSAVRDSVAFLRRDAAVTTLAASAVLVFCTLLQSVTVSAYAPYTYLSGVDAPVDEILSEDPDAVIFYSGRNDAAFVFYARSRDTQRTARVHRASVQLTDPAALAEYVAGEKIDYIVVEVENRGYDTLEVIDRFRDAILDYVARTPEFELRSAHRLPYGFDEARGNVILNVYGRTRQP